MEETRISFMQLASIARKLVDEVIKLQSESLSDTNFNENLQLIQKIQEEYFEQGTNGILEKITLAVKKIQTIIEKTAEISSVINVDISDCISGKREELEALGKNLVTNFLAAASDLINKATGKINGNISSITKISNELSELPSQLGSKLLSMNTRIISEFVTHVQDLITKIPELLSVMVTETSEFIANLPGDLMKCVLSAVKNAEIDADDILNNIASGIGIKFKDAIVDYLLN